MKLEISQAGESTEVDVPEGRATVGGDAGDTVRIEGLPPGILELQIERDRVSLKPSQVLAVDDVPIPRGVSRLLLPGERLSLSEDVGMRLVSPKKSAERPATVAVLKQLLSGPELDSTKAAGFTCLTGLDMGRRFFISGDRCLIGRATDAKVRLRDRAVSRCHARIRKGKEGHYLEDLGSPNGVFVNGSRLRTIRILNEGDIVELGRSLLRFTSPAPEPTPPTPATAEPPPAPPRPARLRRWLKPDWALIGMGAALAIAGLMVTWGFAA